MSDVIQLLNLLLHLVDWVWKVWKWWRSRRTPPCRRGGTAGRVVVLGFEHQASYTFGTRQVVVLVGLDSFFLVLVLVEGDFILVLIL